jgi:hypothetical protein
MSLSNQTLKIYNRELKRLDDLNINYKNVTNWNTFMDDFIDKYKNNKIPYENFRLSLFAIRNDLKDKSGGLTDFLKKDMIKELKKEYLGAGINLREKKDNDTTTTTWNIIVDRTRPFIEDTDNNAYDRLLVALYTFIPPRRSDYWNLQWGNPEEDMNTLSEDGILNLEDYKTKKTYESYNVNLFNDGVFHGFKEAALFKQIIDAIPTEDKNGYVFKNRNGGNYSMVSFATKIKTLFTSVTGIMISILDLRRSFDQWARQMLSTPNISVEKRKELYKQIEMATAHSKSMSEYYADKVEI